MADLADVENAVKALVLGVIYPNGASQPSIVAKQVAIGRGWPQAEDIDAAMGAGNCIVSIFSPPGTERNTTRYPRSDEIQTAPTPTLTATVAGTQVTIGGTVSTPQNVIVLCGAQAFAYQVQSADTLDSTATNVAALIAAEFTGTSAAGAVISIADSPGIVQARIGGQFTIWTEEKRQERLVQITCWCPTPTLRDSLSGPLDLALCQNDFLTAADQSAIRFRYARTSVSDEGEKVKIFRRDFFYTVEYPTASISTAPQTETIGVTPTFNDGSASAPTYV